MQLDDFISIPDQGRVVDAIGEAEKMTSGEIRVHVTPKCGDDVMKDAIKTFNRLEMYKTRHRNGVLIFIAFESRKLLSWATPASMLLSPRTTGTTRKTPCWSISS